MSSADVRGAFLSAAALAVEVIVTPQVADRWDKPSALTKFTVGGIAGHLYLAVRLVGRSLDAPEPDGSTLVDHWKIYGGMRVDHPAELGLESHRAIRADGEYLARRGPAALVVNFRQLLDGLGPRLQSQSPDRLIPISSTGAAIHLDGFLSTRTIEMLVHSDDLACSSGLSPLVIPGDAMTAATSALVELARCRHGDLAVLRAFTRHERQGTDILRSL
jgi:hypothetical protein